MTVLNLGVNAPRVVPSNRRITSNSSVVHSGLITAVMALSIALLVGVSRAQNSFPSQRCISCPGDVSKQKSDADAGGAFVGGAALGVLLTLLIQWMVKKGYCCCRTQDNHWQPSNIQSGSPTSTQVYHSGSQNQGGSTSALLGHPTNQTFGLQSANTPSQTSQPQGGSTQTAGQIATQVGNLALAAGDPLTGAVAHIIANVVTHNSSQVAGQDVLQPATNLDALQHLGALHAAGLGNQTDGNQAEFYDGTFGIN